MAKYLISTTEVYRVGTEEEAMQIIEEAKSASNFQLTKYANEYKEKKQKGEVVDEYYKLTLVKAFNDIKEPDSEIEITYGRESAF